MKFNRIKYSDLNSRQQENYNFQKVSSVLADYGFVTIKLSSDWNGADFIAQHNDGETFMVQLKGRLTFGEKYRNKNLWIAFRDGESDWYIYDHDDLFKELFESASYMNTESWKVHQGYDFPRLSAKHRKLLERFRIKGTN